jgi:hypothetical protein
VGIANWEAYRATIREDIAHLPGYDPETAHQMSDAEVEMLLNKTNGILSLENMEHADDIMLELTGICGLRSGFCRGCGGYCATRKSL